MNHNERILELLTSIALADSESKKEELREKLKLTAVSPQPYSLEDAIDSVLIELGVPSNLKGFDYIITAVMELFNNPNLQGSVVKELYPTVARAHHTSSVRVERNIRHAVETGWCRISADVVHKYFGNSIEFEKCKPTNSEFIWRVFRIVKQGAKDHEMDKLS